MNIRILQGDITAFSGDAIVNAANPVMLGGGGVDGAIHRAAGGGLRQACEAFAADDQGARCPTGLVRVTPGFNLPCRFVIHTVGPIWNLMRAGELRPGEVEPSSGFNRQFEVEMDKVGDTLFSPEQAAIEIDLRRTLRGCYKRSILLATAMGLQHIAFPAISTGVYGCPMKTCAKIALSLVKDMAGQRWPLDVSFYLLYPPDAYTTWIATYEEVFEKKYEPQD